MQMASARSILPSSPPAPLRQSDLLQRLALEFSSDDDLSGTLDELVSEFRSEDVDGPTDFTANLSYWMRHAQSRSTPQNNAVEVDDEDAHAGARHAKEIENDVVAKKQDVEDSMRDEGTEADEELSSLLKELEELDREDEEISQHVDGGALLQGLSAGDLALKKVVLEGSASHAQPPYQAFAEDGSEMPSVFIPTDVKEITRTDTMSDSTPSRQRSAFSSGEITSDSDLASDTTISRPMSAAKLSGKDTESPLATEPDAANEIGTTSSKDLAAVQAQMQTLMSSVEHLRSHLELTMQTFHHQLQQNQVSDAQHQQQVQSSLAMLQAEFDNHQAPILDAILSSQKQTNAASDKLSLALAKQWQQLSALESARTENIRQQQEQISRQQEVVSLGEELRLAKEDAQQLRDQNAQLQKDMDAMRQRNEVLESDRMLMSRVLLQEWGRKECGESDPQVYRYRYKNDKERRT